MNTVYINGKTLKALPSKDAESKLDSGEWVITSETTSETKAGGILVLFVYVVSEGRLAPDAWRELR